MNRDQILSWVTAERHCFADLLEDLDDHEWAAGTLCPEWTVHELAAHLTLSTRTTLAMTLGGIIRARGDWERMEARLATERAARFTPTELIGQIRETADSPRRAPLASPLDPLVDTLVHGQDVARPLGRVREMPADRVTAALDQVLASPFWGARKRLSGVRLVATDLTWSGGKGADDVRGPVAELLMLATGRTAGLVGVTGTGVDRLTAALLP